MSQNKLRGIPICHIPNHVTVCVTGELRLHVEDAVHEYRPRIGGFIQYCLEGRWRWICMIESDTDEEADENIATMACRQLEYSEEGIAVCINITY